MSMTPEHREESRAGARSAGISMKSSDRKGSSSSSRSCSQRSGGCTMSSMAEQPAALLDEHRSSARRTRPAPVPRRGPAPRPRARRRAAGSGRGWRGARRAQAASGATSISWACGDHSPKEARARSTWPASQLLGRQRLRTHGSRSPAPRSSPRRVPTRCSAPSGAPRRGRSRRRRSAGPPRRRGPRPRHGRSWRSWTSLSLRSRREASAPGAGSACSARTSKLTTSSSQSAQLPRSSFQPPGRASPDPEIDRTERVQGLTAAQAGVGRLLGARRPRLSPPRAAAARAPRRRGRR